jgi:hypothetical protein
MWDAEFNFGRDASTMDCGQRMVSVTILLNALEKMMCGFRPSRHSKKLI